MSNPSPVRTIERLGKHHGSGEYRVIVNGEIFSGKTEDEAISTAVIHLLRDFYTVTINTHPPLDPTP